jgi:hypothetical protein
MLVSAREREGAAQALHRHFVSGRLTLDEFADRVRLALQARDRRDLRRALGGLPPIWRDGDELRRVAHSVKRSLVLAVVAMLWLLVTIVLLLAFVVNTLAHGATSGDLIGYPAAWLLVTVLAWRSRRRA